MTTEHTNAAVIGAGPYGLSIAAHLRRQGVEHAVFGRPMSFWAENMPAGMFLKSEPSASNLSDGRANHTLQDYCAVRGEQYVGVGQPVPLEQFVGYGQWFQQQVVPDVDARTIACVHRRKDGFTLRLSDGSEMRATKVVVAVGAGPFAHVPDELAALPSTHVSHSSAHQDLTASRGRRVAVVGGGQSAIETGTLLAEAGAEVTLLVRSCALAWNTDLRTRKGLQLLSQPRSGLGSGWGLVLHSRLPDVFRHFPADKRQRIVAATLGPAGAWWLRDRAQSMTVLLDTAVERAQAVDGHVRLTTRSADGHRMHVEADHVVAGTGYRVDLGRLDLLDPAVRADLALTGSAPQLSRTFESSVPGLYFVGLTAAVTFGPVQRFVYGARFTARRVAGHVRQAA